MRDESEARSRRLRGAVAAAFTVLLFGALAVVGGVGYASGRAPEQYQYRPGWGCGDTNHTHTGPPGRPAAAPPPGCAVAGSH